LTPMPSASVATAIAVKAEFLRRLRRP